MTENAAQAQAPAPASETPPPPANSGRPLREQMSNPSIDAAVAANTAHDFPSLVRLLEGGELAKALSEQYRDLVSGLSDHHEEHGGEPTGSIALTLKFKLDNGTIEIGAESKLTLPKAKRERSVLWMTPEGHLSRLDPRQMEMFTQGRVRAI